MNQPHGSIQNDGPITDAFRKIKIDFAGVKIFTGFNINTKLDQRVNASPEVLKAFRITLQDPYFVESPIKH